MQQIIRAHPELKLHIGVDVDPSALAKARAHLNSLLHGQAHPHLKTHTFAKNFRHIKSVLGQIDENILCSGVDAILMDLGMSSMQVLLCSSLMEMLFSPILISFFSICYLFMPLHVDECYLFLIPWLLTFELIFFLFLFFILFSLGEQSWKRLQCAWRWTSWYADGSSGNHFTLYIYKNTLLSANGILVKS